MNILLRVSMVLMLTFLTFSSGLLNVRLAQNKENGQDVHVTKRDAERLWELAIAAKGGREKLHSIRNIQMSSSGYFYFGFKKIKTRDEFLIVYPNKLWEWDDKRPSVFGLAMTMYNLEIRKRYVAAQGQKEVKLEPFEKSDPISRRFSSLIWLTLETAWHKPIPERVTSGQIGFHKVDVVQTRLNDLRIDFAIDRKTHLPIKISFYLPKSEGNSADLLFEVNLSDYISQQGIMVPTTVNKDKNTYQFNVEYNEYIFTTPPLPAESAADAWKVKKAIVKN